MEHLPNIFLALIVFGVIGITPHFFIRRVFVASAVAGGIGGAFFLIAAYFQDARLSVVPFILGGLYVFIFALFIGLFFYLYRKFLT